MGSIEVNETEEEDIVGVVIGIDLGTTDSW